MYMISLVFLLPLLEPWSTVYTGLTASGTHIRCSALRALVLPETTSSYLIIPYHTMLYEINSA